MGARRNYVGFEQGDLKVIEQFSVQKRTYKQVRCVCACKCGTVFEITANVLISGKQESCWDCQWNKKRLASKFYGVGTLGLGKYIAYDNMRMYKTWQSMLQRCYDEKFHIRYPTYKECSVVQGWLNFQNFAEWYSKQTRQDGWELDKDLLVKGNKVYGPDTCCFIPADVNGLLSSNMVNRGDLPIGVVWHKSKRVYVAQCTHKGLDGKRKNKWLMQGSDPEACFIAYKNFKESLYKEVAIRYQSVLPLHVYNALFNRVVDRDD